MMRWMVDREMAKGKIIAEDSTPTPRKRGRPRKIAEPKAEESVDPVEPEGRSLSKLAMNDVASDERPIAPGPLPYNVVAPPPVPNQRRDDRRNCIITLRAPMQLVDDVDYWVNNRSYKSRSEFILASMRYYLDYLEYRESFNVRTFQRGQSSDVPSERFDRLRYLRGSP